MTETKYTRDHEYVRVADGVGTIGITNYAQEKLGDIVFVELPAIGKVVVKGQEAAVVESVKAYSEVYSPVGGEVVEVNVSIVDTPTLVNEDAEGEAWFVKIRLSDPSELAALMSADAYSEYLETVD
jgi:glycine cleavage system H protein